MVSTLLLPRGFTDVTRLVRELLPELVSQLVYLLVDEESDESSEVFTSFLSS